MPRHRDAPFLSQFPGLQLLRQDGGTVPASEAFKGKKYVLIYFSAHWCPPCQRFTPLLADFYDEHKDTYSFEVLFVSSDREEGRMMDFFQNRSINYVRSQTTFDTDNINNTNITPPPSSSSAEKTTASSASSDLVAMNNDNFMACDISPGSKNTTLPMSPVAGETLASKDLPKLSLNLRARKEPRALTARSTRIPKASGHGNWLALPFKETEVARFLARAYSVVSIPKLVVVAVDTSCMVTREGKTMVLKDPDASTFPWRFAEGSIALKHDGKRECIALFFMLLLALYYYIWGF